MFSRIVSKGSNLSDPLSAKLWHLAADNKSLSLYERKLIDGLMSHLFT